MLNVMSNGNGRIKFPINEPAMGKRKSQIEEYVDFHRFRGVQHVAVATDDIIETVRALRNRDVEFLAIPRSYTVLHGPTRSCYETVLSRVGTIDEDIAPLAELGFLEDRDEDGYLLQIFTKPVQDRPMLFFAVIQRKGAKGFGAGNFKAQFESIEREQARRGNL